ncbi:MAG: glycosyl hydrolase 38 domain protein, partial [Phycisphaerales bacterium]|nr:glycosyl hydrolase 38 domain protein [Phycisphaerales bacterium]
DSLRNVLDGLDAFPNWKVSFEIESYSWAVFDRTDPESMGRLRAHLADATPSARIEILSGTYAQPYAWNASGESNIRHLMYGLADLHAAFPGVAIDTYAVQEPCWTSCLPQLLRSLGFTRAVLKNSTCWGGYYGPTLDAELVDWVGPDGTSVVTVPRYACEGLTAPATTEGGMPTRDFIDRCKAAGIAHPAGTTLQDMGWPGRPWAYGMATDVVETLRYTTWREYVQTVAAPPTQQLATTQNDIKVGLAWGASILRQIAQTVRAGERRVIHAEKMAAMASVRCRAAFPADILRQTWQHVLWSQHHDVWIVPYNRQPGGTWASLADQKGRTVAENCARVIDAATSAIAPRDADGGRLICVFNTSGFRRRDFVTLPLPGTGIHVLDDGGRRLASQQVTDDAGAPALLLAVDVPATGYTTYLVKPGEPDAPPVAAVKVDIGNEGITIESDLYLITINAARGGRIDRIWCKALQREFVDPGHERGFNSFRGFFPDDGGWLSSIDAPAACSVIEAGPLRAVVKIDGHIGPWAFSTRLTVTAGRRRIDFETSFDLPLDEPALGLREKDRSGPLLRIGEPWQSGRLTTHSDERPIYDSSRKLLAQFPVAFKPSALFKDAPFDVCRTTVSDTRYDRWSAIANDVLFQWVDLYDEVADVGLAVMVDHVTAYSHTPDEPLGVVMAYAGPGVWYPYGSGEKPRITYSVVPHTGDYANALLEREHAAWSEPLIARRCAPPSEGTVWSMLDVTDSRLEIIASYPDGDALIVRLFNAAGDERPQRIEVANSIQSVQLIELDGRVISTVEIERDTRGAQFVTVSMPRFGVRTLRCATA